MGKTRFIAVLAIALAALAAQARAEEFPNHPVRFVVPNPPGGGNDLLAREIGFALRKVWEHPIVVDNKPGAGGNIGADAVAKAPPDGHTILMAANTFVINPHMLKDKPFDVQKDFAPITLAANLPIALVVYPGLPVKTVPELIAYAKTKNLSFATPGVGTPQQLAAELFKTMAGIDMLHVPFRGASQMVPEVMAGRVDLLFGAVNSLLPQIEAGSLRGLAVGGATRIASAPNLPTIAEAALPGYNVDIWLGILAPAGTPPAIIQKLNNDITTALRTDEMKQRLAVHGLEVVASTPESFTKTIADDLQRWGKVVRDAKIEPE